MSEIRNLQPQAIWENFYLLTQVPRPSGHLQKIQQFLLDWAKQKGIEAHLDNAGKHFLRELLEREAERRTLVMVSHDTLLGIGGKVVEIRN